MFFRHLRVAVCLDLVLTISAYAAEPLSTNPLLPPTIAPAEQLDAYMLAVTTFLGFDQVEALSKITDEDRRNLAMTYYLRAKPLIASHWSWTTEQIQKHYESAEYAAARAEIEKISVQFTIENPEYVLKANTRVRSLDEQLSSWQTESSVAAPAKELREAALHELAHGSYGKEPHDVSSDRFRAFLTTWRASRRPTIIAPGLSLHGQGRAFDFQISERNGGIVADTDTAKIRAVWKDQGWSEKLSHAVHSASTKFHGPLLDPNEPWHYEYQAHELGDSPPLSPARGTTATPRARP